LKAAEIEGKVYDLFDSHGKFPVFKLLDQNSDSQKQKQLKLIYTNTTDRRET